MNKLSTRLLFVIALTVGLMFQGNAQTGSTVQQKIDQAKFEGVSFSKVELLSWKSELPTETSHIVNEGAVLTLNNRGVDQLLESNLVGVLIELPFTKTQRLEAELIRNKVVTDDFTVVTSSSESSTYDVQQGGYFQGVIRGVPGSWVAISIFNNEVFGVVFTPQIGEITIGKLKKKNTKDHVIFANRSWKVPMQFDCGNEQNSDLILPDPQFPEASNPNNCVRIYFECEYNMYLDNGSSVQNTVNKMTGIYNVVKTLYDNENVNTTISQIFVWDTPDSYSTSSTSNALVSFRNYRTTYNGDLAHLVSRGSPSGGGVAWVNGLCNSYGYAYSYIYSSYSQFPTYSWTVNVIAHEMGHNLGSRHTHDCVWDVDGNGVASEAIDGCGPAAGYSGGSCPNGPIPTNGGTVMSYCHLINTGINWNHGFGTLPGNLVRNNVYNATCLTSCTTCPITINSSKTDIDCNGNSNGSISVSASGGAAPYIYQWSNGATTASISGLTPGTYTVTVTDQAGSGCSVSESITISEPAVLMASASATPETVPGASNGSITLSVAGGTPPYGYLWSTGATTQNLSSLSAGVYTVTVTDANGCVTTASATVSSNGCANLVSSFPYTEDFESGIGNLTQLTSDNFNWILNSGSTSTKRTGPDAAYEGTRYAYVEGSTTGSGVLESSCIDLTLVSSPELSFAYHMRGNGIGTLRVSVSTNNGSSWTTVWSRSGSQSNSWLTTNVDLSNHITGYTKFRVTAVTTGNKFGDIAIDDLSITGQIAPPNQLNVTITSQNDVTCNGGSDGSATALATGGSGNYSYSWSNGNSGPTLSNVAAGTYTITASDVGDPSTLPGSASVTISEPSAITLSFSVTNESGANQNDGAIDLTVNNGASPYSYLWSNGATTQDINNLTPGTYTVTVTDDNGCSQSGQATVNAFSACSPLANLPYAESFESGLGMWQQSSADNFDWTRRSGSTPTKSTGPSSAYNGSFYCYIESNNASSGQYADLIGPCLDLTGTSNPSMSFAYHMYGSKTGTLSVSVSSDQGATWNTVWSKSGNQGNSWSTQSVSLASYVGSVIKVRFRGSRTNGPPRGDMAIDAINVDDVGSTPISNHVPISRGMELSDIHPNPASEFITFTINSHKQTEAKLVLMDAVGKVYSMGKIHLFEGNNSNTLFLENIPSGVYLLVVDDGGIPKTKRFVITKN